MMSPMQRLSINDVTDVRVHLFYETFISRASVKRSALSPCTSWLGRNHSLRIWWTPGHFFGCTRLSTSSEKTFTKSYQLRRIFFSPQNEVPSVLIVPNTCTCAKKKTLNFTWTQFFFFIWIEFWNVAIMFDANCKQCCCLLLLSFYWPDMLFNKEAIFY